MPEIPKRCSRCKQHKTKTEFSPSKSPGHHGLFPWCKPCKAQYYKERNAKRPTTERKRRAQVNRERMMANALLRERYLTYQMTYSLKRRYGLTSQDVVALLTKQEHQCAICRRPLEKLPPGKKKPRQKNTLHIDHDHETGHVRGLLCPSCNSGLGFFKDSEELLRKAIDYLADPPNEAQPDSSVPCQ